eukprot:TRINITY_DN5698_c0_g2_i1.p1 TRINITY_DN5698_c0_g2~~TRINITY_DN5698_c0_g2_i1.p1  ORF type:complete len:755 (-),score=74.70 TRINITY_DN5698_c0_g2_i1:66-2300(-)
MSKLEVRLYAARNLPILTNLGFHGPSCSLTVGNRTSTISAPRSLLPLPKAVNPVWNQTLNFTVDDPSQFLYALFIDTDDNEQKTKMGEVWVPLTGLERGVEVDKWYPLENARCGEVRLGLVAHYDTPSPHSNTSFLPRVQSSPSVQQFAPLQPISSLSQSAKSQLPQLPLSQPQLPLSQPLLPLSSQPSLPQPPLSQQSPLPQVPLSQQSPLLQPMMPLQPQSFSPSQPMQQQSFSPPPQPQIPLIQQPTQLLHPSAQSQPQPLQRQQQRPQGLVNFRPEDLHREFPHIAKGSFGVVFKGKAKGFSETIVIKDLEIQSQKSVDEWRKEISLMSTVKSPFVVDVFGFCSNQKILTIVMEYMVNGDLYQLLHKGTNAHPLSMLHRMRMARHCAMGLSVLHTQSIIHRDVKSMNILVTEDYSCKLTDFGCSKLVSDRQVYNTINSGTPLWMAPEVKRGQYSLPADIYSLGLVLYEIFERKLPLYDQNRQTVVLPKTFQSASVVMPCLNPVPERRPTIHHVVKVLEKMINDVVSSLRLLLPLHEQEMIKQEIQMRMLEGKDVELEVTYRHLLSKPANEVDDLIRRSFTVEIEPQPTKPPQPNHNHNHNHNLPPKFSAPPVRNNFSPIQQPFSPPAYSPGLGSPLQPGSFNSPLGQPITHANYNPGMSAAPNSTFEVTKQQAINSFLAYKEEGSNEVHKNWCAEILSGLLRNRMRDDLVKMTVGDMLNKDTVGLDQFLTVYKQLLEMCD